MSKLGLRSPAWVVLSVCAIATPAAPQMWPTMDPQRVIGLTKSNDVIVLKLNFDRTVEGVVIASNSMRLLFDVSGRHDPGTLSLSFSDPRTSSTSRSSKPAKFKLK